MATEIKRNIRREVERELWARSAGRCEFQGCNDVLYKSPVTQERVNIGQKAHIYSISDKGPRGRGPLARNRKRLNDIGNLLLVCHSCHQKIDARKDGGRYSAQMLRQWKEDHERRVYVVTGVHPRRKSHVVLYGANIGDESSVLQPDEANLSLFPDRYPANEKPVCLNMSWEGRDNRPDYWQVEERNLRQKFERTVRPLVEEGHHFSIFGFAPMPLLTLLGTLFTDKIPAQVYQLHREPEQAWKWKGDGQNMRFKVVRPRYRGRRPALIIALSATVAHERITAVIGKDVSIWELKIDRPNNDFLKSRNQLSKFREVVRRLLVQISEEHGIKAPLAIFPAMPVATAVELGRVRTPKADMPWTIYDHNNKTGAFVKALEIGGDGK